MKHWIILMLVIASIGVATVFGGKWYADQGIQAYYQALNRTEKNYEIHLEKFEMGSLAGEAHWSFKVFLNPCRHDGILHFKGTDHIERNWNGYQVKSTVVLKNPPAAFQTWLNRPIQMTQDINWVGKIHTSVHIPQFNTLKLWNHTDLSTSDLQLELQAERLNDNIQFTQAVVKTPQLSLSTAQNSLQLEELTWTSNQGLNKNLFESGQMSLNIQKANFESFDGEKRYYFELNQYAQQLKTDIQEPLVKLDHQINIQKAEFNGQRALEQVNLKIEINDLKRVLLNQIFKVIEQAQNSCVAYESFKNDIDQSVTALFNEGFSFQLLENTMDYDGQPNRLDAKGVLLPNYEKSVRHFSSAVSRLIDAKFKAQFDPQMISIIFPHASVDVTSKLNSQKIENALQKLESEHKALRSGRLVTMEGHFQLGNFN